jgi:tetratricopeptide (TPR) repeat protein
VKFTSDLATSEVLTMQVAQSSAQGEDMSITLGESSSDLGRLAEDTSSKTMAALAYLKQAEMLREQTHFENGQPAEETVKSRMEAAITAYNMAIKKGQANKTLVSVAQYGLGLCAEEMGQFDEAAKIYRTLISDASLDGTIGKDSASHRLESMANFQDTITFPIVEQPAEVPAPATLPEIGPMLPDANTAVPGVAPNAVPADANATE